MAILSLRSQPFKGIYVSFSFLSLVVRVPYWVLRYLLPAWRPRRSWSLSRCLNINLFKLIMGLNSRTGFFHTPDHTRLELNKSKGELGVYIDGVPSSLIAGDVASWASLAGISTSRIPAYWQHKPSVSPPLLMGERRRPGEKVLLHLHGGGYVGESAHPTNGTSSIPRAIMKHSPSILRALAPEYRKAAAGANPFPAQLLDALAAYVYLIDIVGFRPEDIVISGDSAGGNLALALTRYLIEMGGKNSDRATFPAPPHALVLLSPWADLTASHGGPGTSYALNTPSDFIIAPPVGGHGDYSASIFAGSQTPFGHTFLSHTYISPAATTCTEPNFKDFPPSFISVGDAEIFLDMNLELAKRMEKEGNYVETLVTKDAWHDFIGFEFWEPERSEAAKAIADWIESLDLLEV